MPTRSHDEFLLSWLPRLDRQVVFVNKADVIRRCSPGPERPRGDLATAIHGREVTVMPVSATSERGTADLRTWLAGGADASASSAGGSRRRSAAAGRGLAAAGGIVPGSSDKPLLDDAARDVGVRSATSAVLRVVDLPDLERQAVAATRASARSRGAGPLRRVTSFIYRRRAARRLSLTRKSLLRWRDRGGLGPAVESVREALSAPIRDAPHRSGRHSQRRSIPARSGAVWSVRSIARSAASAPSSRR